MSAYVVILKSGKMISVHKNWLQKPILNKPSRVFFSANFLDVPDFRLKLSYHFDATISACYESRVLNEFGRCL